MPDTLHLSLLGKVHASLTDAEGNEVALDFGTNKALALLCYLAVTKEPQSRNTLARFFWDTDSEEKARVSLRVVLSNLRKILPNHLETTPESVAIKLDSAVQLDVARFDRQTTSLDNTDGWLDVSALEEAVGLYRGDFMADFFIDGAPAFEDWVTSERQYRRQTMLDTLDALASWYLEQRQYSAAESKLTHLLMLEPWDEESHRQLMVTFSRMGDFNRALAQYETCRQQLAVELDVEPMPETSALRDRIVRARQGRTHHLPTDSTPFIGRAVELMQIRNMLGNPTCRLLTIVGLGGMGKTSLALEAARQVMQEQALTFLNGVGFVSLVDIDSVDALPLSIADALGIRLTGQTRPLAELLTHLRNQELLLLLDNFEQLTSAPNDGRVVLQRILDECVHVTLLVTSREALNMAAEWRLDLDGLAYPLAQGSGGQRNGNTIGTRTEQWDAIDLFMQAARQVRPDFQLNSANERAIQRLVQVAIGMPLAIKLAASWLRAMSIERIVSELERSLDILSTRLRDVPARQRSMRAIFDYSWGLLDGAEQTAFLALSICRGGFTEEAAAAVAGATPDLLSSLVDHWLLHLDMTGTGLRYSMHELVRQYAAEKRRQQPDLHKTTAARHSAYFVQYIRARLDPTLHTLDTQAAVQSVSDEFGNVLRCWRHAAQQGNVQEIHLLAPAIYLYALYRSWHAPAIDMLEEAIQAVETNTQPSGDMAQAVVIDDSFRSALLAQLLTRQGDCYFYLSQYPAAAQCLTRALNYAQQGDEPRTTGFALSRSADVAHAQGRYQEALAFATEAQEKYTQVNHIFGLAIVHRELSSIHYSLGNYELAAHHAQSAVAKSEGRGDALARALHCLGLVSHNLGDFTAATNHLRESAEIIRSQGLRHPIGHVWTALAWVACSLGDLDGARGYALEALNNARAIEDSATVAIAQDIMGIAARLAGHYSEAVDLHTEALTWNRALGRRGYVAINLNHLGLAHLSLGNLDQARIYCHECYALSRLLNHRWTQARVLDTLTQLALRQSDLTTATAQNRDALTLARAMGSPPLLLAGLVNHAAYLLIEGDRKEARRLLAFALAQPAIRYETRLRAQTLWGGLPTDSAESMTAGYRAQREELVHLVDGVIGA